MSRKCRIVLSKEGVGGRREGGWSVEEASPEVLGFLLLSLLVVTCQPPGLTLKLPLSWHRLGHRC